MGHVFIDVVLLLFSKCPVLRMPDALIEADNSVFKTLSAAPSPRDELGKLEFVDPHVRNCVIIMMYLDVLPTSISEKEKLRSRFQYSDELVKPANHLLLTSPRTLADSPTGSFSVSFTAASDSPEG